MQIHSLKLHDYSHFLGYTARIMRSIVIDLARKKLAQRHVTLDTTSSDVESFGTDTLVESDSCEIEVALEQLKKLDPRLAQVIELKSQGLTPSEIGQRLHVSERTVRRDLKKVQSFLSPRAHSDIGSTPS
jgi:RNA polymerase sigma factor (sigma-70 family)